MPHCDFYLTAPYTGQGTDLTASDFYLVFQQRDGWGGLVIKTVNASQYNSVKQIFKSVSNARFWGLSMCIMSYITSLLCHIYIVQYWYTVLASA